MFWKRKKTETKRDEIQELIAEVSKTVTSRVLGDLDGRLDELRKAGTLSKQVRNLKEQLADLEIKKAKKEEAYARKERELEHKVGLHMAQVKHEIDVAKKETELKFKGDALTADKKRFEDQMKFHQSRFDEEISGLKAILAEVIKRLPDASFTADIKVGNGGRRFGTDSKGSTDLTGKI